MRGHRPSSSLSPRPSRSRFWIKDGPAVTGTSIMGLMMLGAAMGDTITISADGDGAETAVGALCELVEAKFGED